MYTLDASGVRRKSLKRGISLRTDFHHRGHVAASVAIVGSRPDRHQTLALEPVLVSLLHQLMRPHDQLEPVVVIELSHWSVSEEPSDSPTAHHPALDFIRVRPDQISETSAGGDLTYPIDIVDFFDCVDIRG
jgi:hypothetical protein